MCQPNKQTGFHRQTEGCKSFQPLSVQASEASGPTAAMTARSPPCTVTDTTSTWHSLCSGHVGQEGLCLFVRSSECEMGLFQRISTHPLRKHSAFGGNPPAFGGNFTTLESLRSRRLRSCGHWNGSCLCAARDHDKYLWRDQSQVHRRGSRQ